MSTVDSKLLRGALSDARGVDDAYAEVLNLPTSTFPPSVASLTEALGQALENKETRGQSRRFSEVVRDCFERVARQKVNQQEEAYQGHHARLSAAADAKVQRRNEKIRHDLELCRAAKQERERRARRENELCEKREEARRLAHEAHETARRHEEEVERAKKDGEAAARLERLAQSCKDAKETELAAVPEKQRRNIGVLRERPPEVVRRHDAPARARIAKTSAILKNARSCAASKACQALQEATNHVRVLSKVPWPDKTTAARIGKGERLLTEAIRQLESIYENAG